MKIRRFAWPGRTQRQQTQAPITHAFVLDCRIESGAHLYYLLQPDGDVVHLAEPVENSIVVSAVYPQAGRMDDETADDHRFVLPRKMGASQAAGWLQRELGSLAQLRTVLSVANPQVVYACIAGKVESTRRIVPFVYALERLMAVDGLEAPCVTGVLFGENSLLILVAFSGNGRVFVQTSVAPDNLAEIISSFAASNGVSIDLASLPIYTGEELQAVLPTIPMYPLHPEVLGVSLPTVLARANGAGVAFLMVAMLVWGYLHMANRELDRNLKKVMLQQQQVEQDRNGRLRNNMAGLGRVMAVDFDALVSHAADFWVAGARLESMAAHGVENHVVIVPLHLADWDASPVQLVNVRHVQQIPAGCRQIADVLSSNFHEWRISYQCGSTAATLAEMEQGDAID